MRRSTSDFDSVWKEGLERYFEAFLAFFFPEVHADIDWSRPAEFLDKELHYAVRVTGRGRRTVDALAKVYRHSGEEAWVLAHVEIQSQGDEGFAERMHLVNTLLKARHKRPVASFGILGDAAPNWRPSAYESEFWGTHISMEFPIRKLLDWTGREEQLAADANPIAILMLAHLKTLATRRNPESRLRWKVRILRWLYEGGHKPEEFTDLFRYLDLMMALPQDLEDAFAAEVERCEEERRMPLISNYERRAMQRGMQQGMEQGMQQGMQQGIVHEARAAVLDLVQARFQAVPDLVAEKIQRMDDASLLRSLLIKAGTAGSLEEFLRALPA